MVMDESVLFCTTASTGGSGGCFLAARGERVIIRSVLSYCTRFYFFIILFIFLSVVIILASFDNI